jgi:hypothetical protein
MNTKKNPKSEEVTTQKRRGKRNPEKGKNGKNPKKERRKKTERRMNQCFFGNFMLWQYSTGRVSQIWLQPTHESNFLKHHSIFLASRT